MNAHLAQAQVAVEERKMFLYVDSLEGIKLDEK